MPRATPNTRCAASPWPMWSTVPNEGQGQAIAYHLGVDFEAVGPAWRRTNFRAASAFRRRSLFVEDAACPIFLYLRKKSPT